MPNALVSGTTNAIVVTKTSAHMFILLLLSSVYAHQEKIATSWTSA